MKTTIFAVLIVTLSMTAYAQNSFIKWLIEFPPSYKTDTNYVDCNRYKLGFGAGYGSTSGLCEMVFTGGPKKMVVKLRSKAINRPSFSVSYKYFSVGFQPEVRLVTGKQGKNFEAGYYEPAFGGDFYYAKTDKYNLEGIDYEQIEIPDGCFKTELIHLGTYYVFNHRRFSIPAVFNRCYRQKISCGSVIVGSSINVAKLFVDTDRLLDAATIVSDTIAIANKLSHRSFSLNAGCAYNFIPRKNWLIHLSMMPTLSLYKYSNITYLQRIFNKTDRRISFGMLLRWGTIMDRKRSYFGITVASDYNNLSS